MLTTCVGLFAVCVALPIMLLLIGSAWVDVARTAVRFKIWQFGLADLLLIVAVGSVLLAIVRTGFPTLTEILLFGLASIASPLLWIARFGLEDWLVKRDRRERLLRSLEGVVFEAPGTSNHLQSWRAA